MTKTCKAGKMSGKHERPTGFRKRKRGTGQRTCPRKRGQAARRKGAFTTNASRNAKIKARAREIVKSLAETKQAVLKLLTDAVNRHKPAGAPMVSEDCLTGADMTGEFRWQTRGWSVHLFLQPANPIEICWGSPDESIFDLTPTGRRLYAPSFDSP